LCEIPYNSSPHKAVQQFLDLGQKAIYKISSQQIFLQKLTSHTPCVKHRASAGSLSNKSSPLICTLHSIGPVSTEHY